MNLKRLTFLPIVLCVLAAAGCGKKAAEEIDYGTIKDAVFSQEYFKLTLPLPPTWTVQTQEARLKLAERGAKLVVGDNPNTKAVVDASLERTVNLLAAFKHPLGTPVPFNPSVLCIAEKVDDMPGIKRGKDYHYHSRKLLESGQLKTEFPREISTETLAGVEFDVMHVRIPIGPTTVEQSYYATVRKGYALMFITSFTNAEEEAEVTGILRNLSLN